MQVYDLSISVIWLITCLQSTHLITTFVSDHNEKATVVRLDTIADESWDSWIQLLPHLALLYLMYMWRVRHTYQPSTKWVDVKSWDKMSRIFLKN